MFLVRVSIILARSALEGSTMAGAEDAEEWEGKDGLEGGGVAVEEEVRWPEDRREPDTRLSRTSFPRLGAP